MNLTNIVLPKKILFPWQQRPAFVFFIAAMPADWQKDRNVFKTFLNLKDLKIADNFSFGAILCETC